MGELTEGIVSEGKEYAQFMLHSSELMPGGSPTFPAARDIESLYEDMVCLFEQVKPFCLGGTLSEFAAEFEKRRSECAVVC